jgi:hypothetical protein
MEPHFSAPYTENIQKHVVQALGIKMKGCMYSVTEAVVYYEISPEVTSFFQLCTVQSM